MKYYLLSTVGLEDYKSEQMEAKLCHLTTKADNLQADFYLDEAAHAHFRGAGKEPGSGCVVIGVPGTDSKTEMCFGGKAREPGGA